MNVQLLLFPVLFVFCVGPVMADPLGLIDYTALFEENAAEVDVIDEDRDVLVVGQATIQRDRGEGFYYTGFDTSGDTAMGCLVGILASLDGALQACDMQLEPSQQAIKEYYIDESLAFYSANAYPPAALSLVERRYEALVSTEIDNARPHCGDLTEVTDFADRFFAEDVRSKIAATFAKPRLPVSNPCM